MARDPRYDILFEPVKIGPKTARNRFYQVPHCSGMGWAWPQTLAAMRGMKAAGGWAVVNTEYCSIHPTSDDTPNPFCRLWNDDDVRDNALMTAAVHEHGSLAGVELWHGGYHTLNRFSRETLLAPGHQPSVYYDQVQARPMDKGGHPQLPALAGRGGQARRARRLRHRLCLCRPRLSAGAVPLAPHQPAQRRVWRQPGEPRPPAEGDDPRHPRGHRPRHRARRPSDGRRARGPRGHHQRGRGPRGAGDAGRTARSLGRPARLLRRRRALLALRQGGRPGALRCLREEDHQQAGGRRRPLHLARYHGVAGEARHPRHDRRRPPVDRRSLPAPEDRRRSPRRHPRMHRL